ncbi:MAG: alanine dehydrogenase, partial [Actinobacteria bacterium]|nr:alanine dehydrogenase [Actinomycetota bacterium]
MIVGVPKEIKIQESRIAITPEGVSEFVRAGHSVVIEAGAGLGSAITDEELVSQGATMLPSPDQVWEKADLILKVKEPIAVEYPRMRSKQVLFTYLHLAASKECTDALISSGITAIAYETVEVSGQLPLLAPMSEVAGRMATQVGAAALQKPNGGRGVLLGGVPGVAPGKVVVIGGGVAGLNAAVIAMGMGADVTVIDRSISRLQYIDSLYMGRIKTLAASYRAIEREVISADLVIGAVLVHGAKAPKLVSNEQVRMMKPGSVLVDIAID